MKDTMAGLSVGFVNLPMCMAFAAAAKLSPTVGITSAFWASMFIMLSDSKYAIISVSMSVALMTRSINLNHGPEGQGYCMVFTSLTILFLLYTRLYKFMIIIPKSVMDGFLQGCVLSIFAGQLSTIFSIKIDY